MIAYLYGELSNEEMAKVGAYLEEHPEDKAAVQQLNDTRLVFSELEDEELDSPLHLNEWSNGKSEWSYWRPFVAVAASLLLLLSFAWISDFGIRHDQNGWQIGYQQVVQGISQDEVAALIASEREQTIESVMAYVEQEREAIDQEFELISASIEQNRPSLVLDREKQALMDDMVALSASLSDDYRETMRQLIINFSNNFESQRIQDLENIQAAFNDLEDATIGNQLDIEDELVRLSQRLDVVIANLNNNK